MIDKVIDFKADAIKRLDKEYKEGKYDRYGEAVKDSVLEALKGFVEQDNEFAQAIVEAKGTFADCLTKIMKGCGNSISDLEVYKRAVQFYFAGATIDFKMEINLIGEAANSQTLAETPKVESKKISLSLLDFI